MHTPSKGQKSKGKIYPLNAESQRISGRDKKTFLSEQWKEQRKTIHWERLEMSSRKLEITREHVMQRWAHKRQKWYGPERREDIKKRWQEYTKLYKKDLHDPDNHNGGITHLEPDILECEVKWALESITTNNASEVLELQLSYFKSWKMMLWKCCSQYVSKFGKLSSGHRTGKGQFSFQFQRKAMPKKAQTTSQLHPSHMLVK